ncbi:MAG: hypothetical protein KA477_00905 [Candidatus Levybacteria bacterium]|nr:hypothetical protein [Candidatus Levybacteria bacterium]
MVGFAIFIISAIIVCVAVFYGFVLLFGGALFVAGSISDDKEKEKKAEAERNRINSLIPDSSPLDESELIPVLNYYTETISSANTPEDAEAFARQFESRFLIGKRLMRLMLNLEFLHSPKYTQPSSKWDKTVIKKVNLNKKKEKLILKLDNVDVSLLKEESQHRDYDYYGDTTYKRTIQVCENKNLVFEQTLEYTNVHGEYHFLEEINTRFKVNSYSHFVFKPSKWLFDLFNLCIEDYQEFIYLKAKKEEQKLLESKMKVVDDFFPA